jgi:hypothetical protein
MSLKLILLERKAAATAAFSVLFRTASAMRAIFLPRQRMPLPIE